MKANSQSFKYIAQLLDSVYESDQKYRQQFEITYQRYGRSSVQMNQLIVLMDRADSLNLLKVKFILDKYGWLGPNEVGENGNAALFLVIQHSDRRTRERYLPLMRKAFKTKKVLASDLALLEDRTAIDQGKKQIYGTQLRRDKKTLNYYLLPIEDPDNVDLRRAKVGLRPMSEYLTQWGINWNLEQYKRELPREDKRMND
jgi:hypothetical protein